MVVLVIRLSWQTERGTEVCFYRRPRVIEFDLCDNRTYRR